MPNLTQEDKNFIDKYLPKDMQEKIYSAQTKNEILDTIFDWMTRLGDCWASNGEDYNDLGRATQKVYDNIYLNG